MSLVNKWFKAPGLTDSGMSLIFYIVPFGTVFQISQLDLIHSISSSLSLCASTNSLKLAVNYSILDSMWETLLSKS